jgi:hypothetical protein
LEEHSDSLRYSIAGSTFQGTHDMGHVSNKETSMGSPGATLVSHSFTVGLLGAYSGQQLEPGFTWFQTRPSERSIILTDYGAESQAGKVGACSHAMESEDSSPYLLGSNVCTFSFLI